MATDNEDHSRLQAEKSAASLYAKAVELAREYHDISCIVLQAKLRIGYHSARRLLAQLKRNGDYKEAQKGEAVSVVVVDDLALPFTLEARIDLRNANDAILLAMRLRTGVSPISSESINSANAIGSFWIRTVFTSHGCVFDEFLRLIPSGNRRGRCGEAIGLQHEEIEQTVSLAMAPLFSSGDSEEQICCLLAHITASKTIKWGAIKAITNIIPKYLAASTPFAYQLQWDEAMGDTIKVSVMGIGPPL